MTRTDRSNISLNRFIDHTILKPQAGRADIERLCEEAVRYGFYSVCVNGLWVPLCRQLTMESDVKVCAVVGFPLGAADSAVKAYETEAAVKAGAEEIDMVVSIGQLIDGDTEAVRRDIRRVVSAAGSDVIVKVILETALLDEEQIVLGCKIAEEAGARFVKTSTGFGPGGATVEHVRLMRASVSPGIGVKASGGIRDKETALAMIEAGANRIGTSSGVAICRDETPSGNK